jgi:hypothetical protein
MSRSTLELKVIWLPVGVPSWRNVLLLSRVVGMSPELVRDDAGRPWPLEQERTLEAARRR